MKIKKQKGGITYPQGFYASGLNCGLKPKKKDLSLIYSKVPADAAAVFTKNRVKAWPIQYSEKAIKNKKHQAIITNSGNANCFTGKKGKEATDSTVAFTAKELGLKKKEVLICSTGVIGQVLDLNLLVCSIPELSGKLSKSGGHAAAEGILTTDTVTKEVTGQFKIGSKTIKIGAVAKGAGMVKPNMATMLSFITTDLSISKNLLQKALTDATNESFNCISIDNDLSTNDTVFVLANGLAGNKKITKQDSGFKKFKAALTQVCQLLAKLLMEDGEGVTRICHIQVLGAKSKSQAKYAASAIGDSMLVKTALAGGDPNWGRIIAVLGAKSHVAFKPEKVDLSFGNVSILKRGKLLNFSEPKARKVFSKKEVSLKVNLNSGKENVSFWTTDLTKEYVRINSEYTT